MHYARLPLTAFESLAAYRTQADWEVCVEDDQLWVRTSNPLDDRWQALPFSERFTADAAARLIRSGHRVPSRHAPDGQWTTLASWLPVQRSPSLLSGMRPPPVAVKPVRVPDDERASDLMIVRWGDWHAWVLMAPQARLDPLKFALASDGRVCVKGWPSAPLPGESWVLHETIALRAGWGFPQHCSSSWLSKLLDVPPDGAALWHEDGSAEVLPLNVFVAATRANVRASAAGDE